MFEYVVTNLTFFYYNICASVYNMHITIWIDIPKAAIHNNQQQGIDYKIPWFVPEFSPDI